VKIAAFFGMTKVFLFEPSGVEKYGQLPGERKIPERVLRFRPFAAR
jgi:hypothetical protein